MIATNCKKNPSPIKISPVRVELTLSLSSLKSGRCRNLDLNAGSARQSVPTKPHINPISERVLKSSISGFTYQTIEAILIKDSILFYPKLSLIQLVQQEFSLYFHVL